MMTAVVPGCGNEIIESDEECDGVALAGATCASKGFSGGVLSCTRSCFYNVTACTNASSSRGVNTSSHIILVSEENRTRTLFRSATEFARYYMRHFFGY